ncbi:hypothetical protein HPP92_017273 [Vanilla planifolia]|nr:hypothetical protein HPP92_017273 [Vanilla planifolia]
MEDDDFEACSHWREFEAAATTIGRATHPNLVRLRAYYYAPDERLLIYDYIPNGNLYVALHGGKSPPVPWAPKLAILQGAAKALAYLHERKHAHGNLRSTKILLDDDLRPYLSGFGITRLQRRGGVGIRAEGGYSAPELSGKAASAATQSGDVYAFGVLMMEAATGKKAEMELVEWVRQASSEERSMSQLIGEVQVNPQLMAVLRLALWCTESDPEARPRMKVVVESLDRIGPES